MPIGVDGGIFGLRGGISSEEWDSTSGPCRQAKRDATAAEVVAVNQPSTGRSTTERPRRSSVQNDSCTAHHERLRGGMKTALNVLRWLVLPFWLLCVIAMISCFFDPRYGVDAGLVGLVTTVGPIGVFLAWPWITKRRARRRREAAAAVAARAEWEHVAYMHGDARGLYGQYPPTRF